MRRGRILIYLAIAAAALASAFASVARADDGGGTSSAICADLQDGKLDGSYSQDQWNAFMSDPTVQGYCSVIVPPCVYPGSNGGSGGVTSCTPSTPPPPCTEAGSNGGSNGGSGTTTCQPATPPVTPPSTPTPPVQQAAPVALTPVVIVGVKGAQHTVKSAPKATVKGASHTVKAPVTKAAIAPITLTKTSGTLPFTGAQLALFALVGLALLATGLLLRSTGRPSQRR